MGQFEKIVVLLSFFLVTVILVISFSSDEEPRFSMGPADEVADADLDRSSGPGATPVDGEPGDPSSEWNTTPVIEDPSTGEEVSPSDPQQLSLQALRDREKALRDREAAASRDAEEGESPDLYLDTGRTSRPDPAAGAAKLPAGAALITLDGLTATFEPEIKEYTWQRGDTFVSVARRLYGDTEKSGLLRQFNEDVSYKAPGEKILVPVFDRRSAADRATAGGGTETTLTSTASGTLYDVVEGDSLWLISKKVYGKGSLWEQIFEANQDLLESADDVAVGQKLRIP